MYLHGALHIFPEKIHSNKGNVGNVYKIKSFQKASDSSRSLYLIEQIRNIMSTRFYPVFVCDGTPSQKRSAINQCNYLKECMKQLQNEQSPIVTYGFAFNDTDAHIADALLNSPSNDLYIGYFHWHGINDIKNRLNLLESRNSRALKPKNITFYDQQRVSLWR
jgi:hypothetical protein